MRKNRLRIVFCVYSLIQIATSQNIGGNCTNYNGPRRCVDIDMCLNLREIYHKKGIHYGPDIDAVATASCGGRNVCCELPFILPEPPVCGNPGAHQRIVGGYETAPSEFPWTVLLQSSNQRVLCGGSLINTRYIVTAAHCVSRFNASDIHVLLGEWDIDTDPDCDDEGNCNPNVVRVKVDRVILHPNYRKNQNDIALLRIENALPENYYQSHIEPICLPTREDLQLEQFNSTNVSIIGWGHTEFQGNTSNRKLAADIRTISNEECQKDLQQQIVINTSHLCAKPFEGFNQDSCFGDSGGPLQILRNGTYYLIGVIGAGLVCGSELPAIYARVTSHLNWILETIKYTNNLASMEKN